MATPNPRGTQVLAMALPSLQPPLSVRLDEKPFDHSTVEGLLQSTIDKVALNTAQRAVQATLNALPDERYHTHIVSVFTEWAPRP